MATYIVREKTTAEEMTDAAKKGWAKGQAQAEEQIRINRTCDKCGSTNASMGEVRKKKRNILVKFLRYFFFFSLGVMILMLTFGKVNIIREKATRTVTCLDCGNKWDLQTAGINEWVKVK